MNALLAAHSRVAAEPKPKLQLAEEVLDISNRNIQITIKMFLRGNCDAKRLLAYQAEDTARIRTLVQNVREQLESKTEKELFEVASARWSSAYKYEDTIHIRPDATKLVEAGTGMPDALLPQLLDNASWRVFVEFLRTQLEFVAVGEEHEQDLADRTRELIRANQTLKSTIAERKRIQERLSQLESIIESSSDAITIHALDGTMVSWNKGAESVYGYSASEVLGSRKIP